MRLLSVGMRQGINKAFLPALSITLAAAVGGIALASSGGSETEQPRPAELVIDDTTTSVGDVPTSTEPGAPSTTASQSVASTSPTTSRRAAAADLAEEPATTVPASTTTTTVTASTQPAPCSVTLGQTAAVATNCANPGTVTVNWLTDVGCGTDLPWFLPSGRRVDTCPQQIATSTRNPVGPNFTVALGSPPPDANCVAVIIGGPGTFVTNCKSV